MSEEFLTISLQEVLQILLCNNKCFIIHRLSSQIFRLIHVYFELIVDLEEKKYCITIDVTHGNYQVIYLQFCTAVIFNKQRIYIALEHILY